MARAFVVSSGLLREAVQAAMPEWRVLSIGSALVGQRFDLIVVAEDFSDERYRSETWREMRDVWFAQDLRMKLRPGGKWITLTWEKRVPAGEIG